MNGGFELVTRWDRMRELEPTLWELFQRDQRATPFQSPAWLLSWIECFASAESLRILVGWNGDLPCALLPLWLDRTARGPVLKLVGTGVGDYLDGLADPGQPDILVSLARSLAELMEQESAPVELSDLRPDSPLLLLAPGFRNQVDVASTCPFLTVEGSFEDYWRLRPLSLRRNVQRTQSHLRRLGRVEFRLAQASNIERFMETFLDLHATRWREKGQANVLADRAVRRFHQLVASSLQAHQLLDLLTLCLDDCPMAMAYVLRRHQHFMYLTAFDPSLGQVSLGSAIIAESIARAFRAQAPGIDFLRGRERYKYDFGGRDRNSLRLVLGAVNQAAASPA